MNTTLRKRLLVLLFAACFLGGPSLAQAAAACAACCCDEMSDTATQDAPQEDCGLEPTLAVCCEVAPAKVPQRRDRISKTTSCDERDATAHPVESPAPLRMTTPARLAWPDAEIAHRVSPLRRSVVLQR